LGIDTNSQLIWFGLLCYVIGLKYLCHFVSQSEVKPKTNHDLLAHVFLHFSSVILL